jgi:hypothetical protein
MSEVSLAWQNRNPRHWRRVENFADEFSIVNEQ